MSVINTNISSIQAQNSLRVTQLNQSTAMERLSSGVRINSAKDDAAGLAISTRMTANIRGIAAAVRNANDGISLTQTAEGSLGQIGDNLQRIRELAVQSANTGNNASDRAAMNNEAKQLVAEIDRVASNSAFNGIKLLDGTFQNQGLQVGAGNDSNDRITISVGSAKSSALGVGSNSSYAATTVGTSVGATALAGGALNINGNSVGAAQADGVSNTASSTSGIAVAAAINAISDKTNVKATVSATTVAGSVPSPTGYATVINAGDVKVNGVSIGPISQASSAVGRGGQVAAAVNAVSSQTGVTATFDNSTGSVALSAADGRNITVTSANAGGSSLVTGLGQGTTTTMVAPSASATNIAAASGLKINGVEIATASPGISKVTTNGANAPTVTATFAGTNSLNQVDTAQFVDILAGSTVAFGGLTFTSGSAGTTAAQLQAAFSSVNVALTSAAQANTFAGTSKVNSAIGTFTAGTSLAGTMSATAGSTDKVAFTATSQSTVQISTLPAGSVESSVITFSAMKFGASVALNGTTFTASRDVTGAEVATAFASASTTAPNGGAAYGVYVTTTWNGSATTAGNFNTSAVGTGADTDKITITQNAAGATDVAISASSKFTDLVANINAKTGQTGVTATLDSAGKISLSSTTGIELAGNDATITGIGGSSAAAITSNTLTARSTVSLSSTSQSGINISGSTAASLAAAGLSEGSATVSTTVGSGVSSLDLTTAAGSQAALTTLDAAINTVTDSRAAMGAYQNRLTASISNLETTSQNLSASRSRIMDTDYAKESTNLARAQIISQAATAMLAQANQSSQSVLALLK